MTVDKVAQQRKRQAQLLGKRLLRRRIIRADGEHLRAILFVLLHSSLERVHFSRSTTRKGGGEEGEYHRALADIVGQMNGTALSRREREIGSLISDLQRRGWGRLRKQAECQRSGYGR